ncbi:hypothetical protein AAFN86_22175 [Roseomonas sp. CAU 1739]
MVIAQVNDSRLVMPAQEWQARCSAQHARGFIEEPEPFEPA